MGCGSSSQSQPPPQGVVPQAQGGPPPPAASSPRNKQASATPTQNGTQPPQQQQQQQQKPSLAQQPSNSSTKQAQPAAPAAAAAASSPPRALTVNTSASESNAPVAPSPRSGRTQLAPIRGAPLPPGTSQGRVVCDADAAHIATIHCAECEENYCGECDNLIHSRKKFQGHTQRRRLVPPSPSSTSATSGQGPRPPSFALPPAGGSAAGNGSGSTDSPQQAFKPRTFKRTQTIPEEGNTPSSASSSSASSSISSSSSSAAANAVASSQPPARVPSALGRKISNPPATAAQNALTGDKYIHSVPVDKLKTMGAQQLTILFAQYDIDGNGSLDKKELKLLASDCIDRTLKMYEDEIRRTNPNMSENNIKKAVEKEKMFLLPAPADGKTRKKEDFHRDMTKYLIKKLDVTGEGVVSKNELMVNWNNFANTLFTIRTDGALDCIIM